MPLAEEKTHTLPPRRPAVIRTNESLIASRDATAGCPRSAFSKQINEFVDLMPSKSGRERPTMPAQFPDLA